MSHVLLLRTRSMHPLLRAVLALVGVALFALLMIFGAVALLVLLGVGAVTLFVNRLRHARTTAKGDTPSTRDPRVLEGDYVVVDKPRQPPR